MDLEEIKNLSFGELLNGLLLYLEAKSYTCNLAFYSDS